MKKLIIIALSSLVFGCGCLNTEKDPELSYYDGNCTNCTLQSQFNEETYIWENFIFSTNRVNNIRR